MPKCTLFAAATTPRDRALLAAMLGAGCGQPKPWAWMSATCGRTAREALLHVRRGKGRKDRIVPVHDDVARHLRAYLAATGRRLGDTGPLFYAHDRARRGWERKRLSERAVGYRVAKLVDIAGIAAK